MVDPIGARHHKRPLLNGDGPPKQTGLITNDTKDSPAETGRGKYSHPAAEYNRRLASGGGRRRAAMRQARAERLLR
jgi:hypothetical protein